MRTATYARLALVVALTVALGAPAVGQDNPDLSATEPEVAAEPEAAAEQGFPWLCFATAVGALVGLYVLVRRREREAGVDGQPGRAAAAPWYCRACDRDVDGPECPRCGATNPFLDVAAEAERVTRRRRSRAV